MLELNREIWQFSLKIYVFSNGNYKTKKSIFIQFEKGKKKNWKEKPQLSTLLVFLLVKRFIGSTSSVSNSEDVTLMVYI
jgi:hypothetical protein